MVGKCSNYHKIYVVTTPVAVAAAVVTALGVVVVAATATTVVDNNHMAAAVAVKTCTILFATLIVSTIECVKVQMPS